MLGGYAENAQATFDINNTTHTITVHLLNLQLNPTDVDQAIGSLRFTLTGAGTPAHQYDAHRDQRHETRHQQ